VNQQPGIQVLKFGGELLEEPSRLAVVVGAVSAATRRGARLAIVHGGGKEIDAALKAAGIERKQVDGLRVTDDRTLEVVVNVLAGTVNTRFVAALTTAGVDAVGLTGADAGFGLVDRAPAHHAVDGSLVDLGRVGVPTAAADLRAVSLLAERGFVPVIACIGLGADGQLYNVNADTFAGHLAARLRARRLVIAGTTPGVLDARGTTMRTLERAAIEELIGGGTATAGMVAKLRACEYALAHGVGDVVVVDGRDRDALDAATRDEVPASATRLALAAV
jgi:acetylglutamate kinase